MSLRDPARLESSPLIEVLRVRPAMGSTRGEALHELLREMIEKLKPDPPVPLGRAEWLAYRILWLHYVRCLGIRQVCAELDISESTFYRWKRVGLDAVVAMLWDWCRQVGEPGPERAQQRQDSASSEDALERSIELARTNGGEFVDLTGLFEGVMQLVQPLALERRVVVQGEIPRVLPRAFGDPSILRQAFVSVLAEAIEHAGGQCLRMDVQCSHGQLTWCLRGIGASDDGGALETRRGFVVSQGLLLPYNGRLSVQDDVEGGAAICVSLPTVASQVVLVMDDEPGAIDLYRRYLQGYPCTVFGVRTLDEIRSFSGEVDPVLLLLDVIMPRTDGWTILRALKEAPDTAGIPVIVCSVIDQPQLALALGAAQVLTKPFGAEDLLRAVGPWLSHRDSSAAARRGPPPGA